MSFVHLHLHTEYSLLDGECRIERIPSAVRDAGQTAVAVTDKGVLYGAFAFAKECASVGVKPIIGCEVYVAPRYMENKERLLDAQPTSLVLLVKNDVGYRNLLSIVTLSNTKGFFDVPRTDRETLGRYHEGLIALSGFPGSGMERCLRDGDRSGAHSWAEFLEKTFGHGNFYIELCCHGGVGEKERNDALIRIAETLYIPLVAANAVDYLRSSDAAVYRLLHSVRDGTAWNEHSFSYEEQAYLKTETEMRALFADHPEAIDNTGKIASKCDFSFDCSAYHLPLFRTPNGEKAGAYLRFLCMKGYQKRIASKQTVGGDAYLERMEYELNVIETMGFSDYYLIVWDFVREAKEKGIPVGPGRGSGVSSLVAYCIGIIDVDPMPFGLLFERFLNPERVSMPDFDIDIADERRGEVIEYVTEKYGKDRVSQIITFGTMACRQALRDAGKALGASEERINAVLNTLPKEQSIRFKQAFAESKELQALCSGDENIRKLVRYATLLEGRPRNASTHASGVVVSDRPLTEYVPLSVNDETVVTQYPMNAIGELGLLKIDFLGSKNLSVLRLVENAVQKKEPDFRLDRISLSDERTFDLLCAGRSHGVFQLESDGMRGLLRKIRPRTLEDIVIVLSIFRPGPALSIETFLKNRKEPEKIAYPVSELEPILKETYGCMLYQEQVMQICRVLAGYSLGHADLVRRAMAKKKPSEMEKERASFLEGCASHGVSEQNAGRIFELMKEFAKYAFNKSHAVAYALFAYRCAYLKAHYPKEFFCALLNVNFSREKLTEYDSELSAMGIRLLPPDIFRSEVGFSAEEDGIRYGLACVRNIGLLQAERMVTERNAGAFSSLEDLLMRLSPSVGVKPLEALTYAGALDGFGFGRGSILSVLEKTVEQITRMRSGNAVGQIGMFDAPGEEDSILQLSLNTEETLDENEKLEKEKEYLGLYLSGHPLDKYVPYRNAVGGKTVHELWEVTGKPEVHLVACIRSVRARLTKKNTTMAFALLSDQTGSMELIVFPTQYEQYRDALKVGGIYDFFGSVSLEDSRTGGERKEPKMILKNISIPDINSTKASAILQKEELLLYLRVTEENKDRLSDALQLCAKHKGTAKILCYFAKEERLRAYTQATADPTEELLQALKTLLGEENVALKMKTKNAKPKQEGERR